MAGRRVSIRGLLVLLACAALLASLTLAGCGDQEAQNFAVSQEGAVEQEERASHVANGSVYEKAETVSVATTLSGEVKAVAVDEWIKNPDGLDTIEDVSTLQQVTADEGVTFTQDGTHLTWAANGKDVRYSGVTDEELPFAISYAYRLDGEEIDPSQLKNVTGHLELEIVYENKTSVTVYAQGSSHAAQLPFVMASLVSFDAEHAKNVVVSSGKVLDQEGSFIAVGLAMPGLAQSLGLEDMLDLPQSVTVSADVTGFDMPNVTTVATDRALGLMDGEAVDDASAALDDAFGQVSAIQDAIGQLAEGTEAIGAALDTIGDGQDALNAALPGAAEGLGQLAEAQEGVSGLVDASGQSLGAAQAAQAETAQMLTDLRDTDTTGWTQEQIDELDRAIASLEGAQQSTAAAVGMLEKAGSASDGVAGGLASASDGLSQIQAGYEQLAAATGQVSEAAGKLSEGAKAMGEGVKKALDQARGGIEEKIELVSALSECAEVQGALCGNAEDMPASTTYVITAQAD